MKIIAIRGKNIASLEGEFEIDFMKEPLLSSGIYAITGPTGAGKSSILDVLSLALYEDTPRLNKAGDSKIYDVVNESIPVSNPGTLLRRGATEGYAEVDFVGNDSQIYRSTWTIRRAYGKAKNKLQPSSLRLRNLTKDTDFQSAKKKEILAEIERLIGLSYNQFTRTVLLAQGEFATFLKANDNDRATLLEKLTGTEIYTEISKRIYQRTEAARKEYEEIQLQMDAHNLLSEEEFSQRTLQLNLLIKQINNIKEEERSYSSFLAWFVEEEKLLALIDSSSKSLHEAETKRTNESEDRDLLDTISELQEGFTLMRKKQDSEDIFSVLSEKSTSINKKIDSKNIEFEAVDVEFKANQQNLNAFNETLDEKQSKIKKAFAVEEVLKGIGKSLADEKSRIDQTNENILAKENSLKEWQKAVTEKSQLLVKGQEWIRQQESRKGVAENYNLIIHKLGQASSYLHKIKENEALVIQEEKKIADLKKQRTELDIDITCTKNELENNLQNIVTNEGRYEAFHLEDKKKAINTYSEKRSSISDLLILWNRIESSIQEIKNNNKELLKLSEDKNKYHKELLNSEKELLILEGAFKQSEKNLLKLQQETAENIESLRADLTDDAPCPVCGSLEHPYQKSGDQVLRNLLESARKDHADLKEKREQTLNLLQQIRLKLEVVESNTSQISQRNSSLSKLIDDNSLIWSNNKLSETYPLRVVIAGEVILDKVKGELDDHIVLLNKEISNADKIKLCQDDFRKTKADLDRKFAKQQQDSLLLSERLIVSEKTLGGIRNSDGDLKGALDKELNSVDGYFQNDSWRKNWIADPSGFQEKIKQFSEDWVHQKTEIEDLIRYIALTNSNIELEKKNLQELANTQIKQKESYSASLKAETDSTQKLRELTGDKTASWLESMLKQEKEKLTNLYLCSSEKITKLKEELAALKGGGSQVKIQLDQNQKELSAITIELKKWIDDTNSDKVAMHAELSASDSANVLIPGIQVITEDRIKELMKIPLTWINDRRKQFVETDKIVVTAESTLKTYTDNLEQHRLKRNGTLTREEVDNKFAKIKDEIRVLDEERAEITAVIKQHTDNMLRLKSLSLLREEKNAIYQNWSLLNSELGKADGGKFKNIAQGYTLDLLIQTANVHIRTIAPRYRLQRVSESLSLQVIDRDMCDQIRSVHSLSGGETFLVSLSLALGLSSLSSRNINIESLFIDEGFGSLDEESLMMAMDALESLRLQGRKVGVITHVKEMTERIATRIKVEKKQNGASRIVIE